MSRVSLGFSLSELNKMIVYPIKMGKDNWNYIKAEDGTEGWIKINMDEYFDIFDKTEKYIDELKKQETKLVLSIKQFKDEKSYAPPEGLNGDGWEIFKDADYNTKRNIIVQYFINVVNAYLVIFNKKIKYLQALNNDACKVISVAYRRRREEGSEE